MKLNALLIAASAAIAVSSQVFAEELKFANFTPSFHTINASVIEKLNTDLSAATSELLINQ